VQKTLAARQHVVDVCGKAISACERWLRGESYTTGLKATDVQAYLRSATVSRIKRAA
jgi:hypothetical protein